MSSEFPAAEMEATHVLVVSDPAASRRFYEEVLGAEVVRAYGTSIVLRFLGTWLLLVEGGGPTADKPTVAMAPPSDPDTVSHEVTIRVPDCRAACTTLRGRGAEFLAEPAESASEVRAFFRDPDGQGEQIAQRLLRWYVAGTATAKRTQRQKGKKIVVEIKVKAKEDLKAEASGRIKVNPAYKLETRAKRVARGTRKTLKLKPKKKKQARRIARALKRGNRVRAKARVKLTDGAGNEKVEKFKVKMKR
jgi:catechol 2,3-dioxygenase-like lactoylglutathione lyase family enzyme